MLKLSIRHFTRYTYRRPVKLGPHRIILRPAEGHDQHILESRLTCSPPPLNMHWFYDVHGNCGVISEFDYEVAELHIESSLVIEHYLSIASDIEMSVADYATYFPFSYVPGERSDLRPSIMSQYKDTDGELAKWIQRYVHSDKKVKTLHLLKNITSSITRDFLYVDRSVPGVQSPRQTLQLRSGTCRDFAVLMVEALRLLGLAARLAVGYIYDCGKDDAEFLSSTTHAWLRVYLPGAGWTDFDPTNGSIGNNDLIRVAVVRDIRQGIPISGSFVGTKRDFVCMDNDVEVKRL